MSEGPTARVSVISSIIVQARDGDAQRIGSRIESLPEAEIYARQCGKLIAVIETTTDGQLAEVIASIQEIPGVLGTNLVFHHTEAE